MAPPFLEEDRFVGADGIEWRVAIVDPPWGDERWPRTAYCVPDRATYPIAHFGDPMSDATHADRHFSAEELARWLACGAVALL